MLDLAELTKAWAHGWSVSRGTTPPVAISGGLKIDIDQTRNTARYILEPYDWQRAADLGRELTTTGTEIKIVGAADSLREALKIGWTMYDVHHLMTVAFTHGVAETPPSCTARIVNDGAALLGTICDSNGDIVSRARLAASGRYGVIDRVRTRAADQRRGMGRAVMTMLGNRALDEGLTTGCYPPPPTGGGSTPPWVGASAAKWRERSDRNDQLGQRPCQRASFRRCRS